MFCPDLSLPGTQILNYGQGIFEGMKAQESAKGRIVIFRPDKNAERFGNGAIRMSMPPVPADMFVEAVKSIVASNSDYVSAVCRTYRTVPHFEWRCGCKCKGSGFRL